MSRFGMGFMILLMVGACATRSPEIEQTGISADQPLVESRLMRGVISDQLLTAGCFGCHGPEGRSGAPAIPSLAGLSEDYFIQVMQAYQYGGRYASIMGRIALGYDADEITRMARYFSQLQPVPRAQRVDWRQVNKGRQLHRLYCLECHGDLQAAASHEANRLNGQWMDYLRWTLQDYLIGINQADAQMSEQLSALVKRHGGAGLEALVNYFGSARP
ncbi:MAG: cytochrome c4 [Gammaproteobacteria bacterium]|nr:cytochrome c4 [Gammaproteobacteria bacterium]